MRREAIKVDGEWVCSDCKTVLDYKGYGLQWCPKCDTSVYWWPYPDEE